MIEERLLTDPLVCPACATALQPGVRVCAACSLPLRGPLAQQLWTVSVQAFELLERRRLLIEQLRATARPQGDRPSLPPHPATPHPATPHPANSTPSAARPEWSRRQVQNLLLGLGVLLLAVAAVIFVVVSWGHLGIGGRAAILAGVTAIAGTAAAVAHRRGMDSTAEWLAALAVALAVLDAFGLRRAGLATLDTVSGPSYWASAFAVIAVAAALASWPLPTRSLRLAAAVLGQIPIPVLTLDRPGIPDPAGFAAQTLLVLLTAAGLRGLSRGLPAARDARLLLTASVPVWWMTALSFAFAAGHPARSVDLLVLAGIGALAAWLLRDHQIPRTAACGAATGAVIGAAVLVAAAELATRWVPLTTAGLAVAVLVVLLGFAPGWRSGSVEVTGLAAFGAALTALPALLAATMEPFTWLTEPWSGSGGSARAMLAPNPVWYGGSEIPLVLLAVAPAPVLVVRLLAHRWPPPWVAVPLVVPAILTVPPALDLRYPVGVGLHLLLGTGFALAGLVQLRQARTAARTAVYAATAVAGSLLVAVALAVSLARPPVTVAALTATLVAALYARILFRLPAAGALMAGLGWALAAALTRWAGGEPGTVALVLAVTAAVLGAVSPWLTGPSRASLMGGRIVCLVGYGLGVLLLAGDPHRLWLALLAGGVAAGLAAAGLAAAGLAAAGLAAAGTAAAYRAQRRVAGWMSALLLTASTWVRLVLAGVTAVEAYTVPAGVALLVMGHIRRRGDVRRGEDVRGSWSSYGSGLGLVLLPSLLAAVTDDGMVRPVLLGLVALAVLAAGVAQRLAAPLTLGGLTLAVDGLVQLSPFLVGVYDALPRWVSVGMAGLVLVALGATYENRMRDVRRLQRGLRGLR